MKPSDAELEAEWLKEVRERVMGAFRLTLSSVKNPCHPDNIEHYREWQLKSLDYASRLLSLLDEQEKEIEGLREVLEKIKKLEDCSLTTSGAICEICEIREECSSGIAKAALSGEGVKCVCGNPSDTFCEHQTDGPCYRKDVP